MLRNIVDGPLTKTTLKQFLKNEPSLSYLGDSIKTSKGSIKYDGVVLDSVTEIKIAIKLKEPKHYLSPADILETDDNRWAANKSNYKVIEIPYFIQLSNEVFEHYFGRAPQIPIVSDCPSGFEDPNFVLPANYCSMGVNNFLKELGDLPQQTFGMVYESLLDKSFTADGDPFLTFPIDMLDEEFWEMLEDENEEQEDEEEE